MESTRQKKVSRQLLKDLSEILQLHGRDLIGTSFVSVTVVRVSPDLSIARVYISVFGTDDKDALDKIRNILIIRFMRILYSNIFSLSVFE